MVEIQPFDPVHYLDNPEVVAHYLAEAFQSGDRGPILRVIQNVARAGYLECEAPHLQALAACRHAKDLHTLLGRIFEEIKDLPDNLRVAILQTRRRNALRELAKR
jgi:addiction module antidote-like protein